MKHLTMQQLHEMGFEVIKAYEHDDFMTQKRKKGIITIEATWKKTGEFESQDLSIDQIDYFVFDMLELQALDQILNKTD